MTVAICFKCGAIKHGAFTHCVKCGLRPETDIEIAHSLAYSDHHHSIDTLQAISQDMSQGASLPRLSKELEQKFVAAAREYLPIYRNLLGPIARGRAESTSTPDTDSRQARASDVETQLSYDYADLATDTRQPAAYPTPDYLKSFAISFAASDTNALEQQRDKTTLVNLVFQTPEGREGVIKNVDWRTVEGAWALTRIAPTGTVTCHLRFSQAPSDSAQPVTFSESIQAVTFHELVHIYRTRGLFNQAEWNNLLMAARGVGIMQISIRSFLNVTGEAAAENIPNTTTLEHFYDSVYKRREIFQELMDQEAVAHFVEFARRGIFSPSEVPFIQDLLNEILTAQIARRSSVQLAGRSLFGVLARIEPQKSSPN